MAIKRGYKYSVKYVKQEHVNGVPITKFSIGDKIKYANNEYQNYDFTVWGEHKNISDGDKVVIDQLDSIECRTHGNKLYFGLTGKCTVQETEEIQYTEDTPVYSIDKDSSKTKYKEPEQFIAIEDDDTPLPFDL